MLKEQETEVLGQYEAMLADACRRFDEARKEMQSLERIVTSMRQRLSSHERGPAATHSAAGHGDPLPTYRGRATLPGFLKRLMADGRRRTLDQIEEAVQRDANFADRRPNRNTLSNRMHELTTSGYVRRVERGIYELAAVAANENGSGREGPNLAIHPASQQPRGEGLIDPRPGQPDSGVGDTRSAFAA